MANSTLSNAKAAKKDEFYTMFYDIETEMEAYLDYNPNVFRGKTVLLPCDDPEWSMHQVYGGYRQEIYINGNNNQESYHSCNRQSLPCLESKKRITITLQY